MNERDIEREISLAWLSGMALCIDIIKFSNSLSGALNGAIAAEETLRKAHTEKFGLTKGE